MISNEVLGVRVDRVDTREAVEGILTFFKKDSASYVATVNPEFIMAAQTNATFRKVLNHADLVVIDGIGIIWALDFLDRFPRWICYVPLRKMRLIAAFWFWMRSVLCFTIGCFSKRYTRRKVSGVDLLLQLFSRFTSNERVFLLGGNPGSVERACSILSRRFPHLVICGAEQGIEISIESESIRYREVEDGALCDRIVASGPSVVLVGFGAVKQELWIAQHLVRFPTVKLFIGVGGAIDFFARSPQRAPFPIRVMGLEWLWRLILEPHRLRRIWTAVVRFPLAVGANAFRGG